MGTRLQLSAWLDTGQICFELRYRELREHELSRTSDAFNEQNQALEGIARQHESAGRQAARTEVEAARQQVASSFNFCLQGDARLKAEAQLQIKNLKERLRLSKGEVSPLVVASLVMMGLARLQSLTCLTPLPMTAFVVLATR